LLTRLGGVGGVREEAGTDLSEAVFAALYARADSAFWLDSSATQCAEGGEGGKEGRREGRREGGRAAVPPAMGGRFSYMGDASSGSSLAHVLEYYLPPTHPPHPPPPPSLALLREVDGRDGRVRREVRGITLFEHLQACTRRMREEGIVFTVVEGRGEGGAEGWAEGGFPEFWGGYVGYFGYELKDDCVRLQRKGAAGSLEGRDMVQLQEPEAGTEGGGEGGGEDEPGATPDAAFVFADRIVAFDHVEGSVMVVAVVEMKGGSEEGEEEAAARAWLQVTEAKIRALGKSVEEQRRSQRPVGAERSAKEAFPAPARDLGSSAHSPSFPPSPLPSLLPSPPSPRPLPSLSFAPLVTPLEYKDRVDRCMELIAAGETYEVCLTGQLAAPLPPSLDPFLLYTQLRRENPAPFSGFWRHDPKRQLRPRGVDEGEGKGGLSPVVLPSTLPVGDSGLSSAVAGGGRSRLATLAPAVALCCSSPERFLRVARANRVVESKPIKGTVRRGQTSAEDARLAAGLAACEKNRAENLMIVDLVRNDISRVTRPGSVQVPRLMAVESYATVHQLVSTITGVLDEGKDAIDAVIAAFPGGSMTGAPKKRTMEIIDRLEGGQARGPYSGALGYIAMDGLAADLNIVIRTAVCSPGIVTVGAGGAIVALSDREKEYEEMMLKARAVAGAVGGRRSGEENEEEEGREGAGVELEMEDRLLVQ
jgi:para-aminobenzoate synthetase